MKAIFILIILFSVISINAQEVTNEQTIKYINGKLKNNCVLEAKTNQLILQFYKGKEMYRQDKANVYGLDPDKVSYKAEENAIILYCLEPDDECVMRWIFKNNVKKTYSRSNISVENLDEKSINGLVKAFSHLIKTYHVPDYKLYEYFE
ncbi:MAG: hypothetical protein A2046_15140 [Bacteroidetes bacterium GWA2_30_7]|nr:MAG: hypothetical protein A2046_15140 [Bacteroidetes bacterium GWA2_30_7]